jgi:hypothetical protein
LLHLINNPDQLEKLKTTIPKVPSMVEMSSVWEQIYHELISQND